MRSEVDPGARAAKLAALEAIAAKGGQQTFVESGKRVGKATIEELQKSLTSPERVKQVKEQRAEEMEINKIMVAARERAKKWQEDKIAKAAELPPLEVSDEMEIALGDTEGEDLEITDAAIELSLAGKAKGELAGGVGTTPEFKKPDTAKKKVEVPKETSVSESKIDVMRKGAEKKQERVSQLKKEAVDTLMNDLNDPELYSAEDRASVKKGIEERLAQAQQDYETLDDESRVALAAQEMAVAEAELEAMNTWEKAQQAAA